MDAELGLRERKKQRTRQLIADTARRLFAERGFDAVPVAEVARAAEVSEATVFNYFPTKEALVYQGMEAFEANLLRALRDRPPAEPLVAAFRRFVLDLRGVFASDDPEVLEAVTAINRTIAASPSLLAHEREIFARYTDSLAVLIAEETHASPGDIRPRVIANALIGVHRALVDYTRRHLIEGTPDRRRLARNVRKEGQQALAALEEGLANYAPKQSEVSAPDAADWA